MTHEYFLNRKTCVVARTPFDLRIYRLLRALAVATLLGMQSTLFIEKVKTISLRKKVKPDNQIIKFYEQQQQQ